MDNKEFVWIPFYTEFADKLLDYKDNRKALIEKVIKVYASIGFKLPTLDSGELLDIDPFTIFGLFNKGLTDKNRKTILEGFAKEFQTAAEAPETFPGIPVLNNMAATFYAFQNDEHRQEHDIDTLWDVFSYAIKLADDDTAENRKKFSSVYDKAITQYLIKWNLTMGLYWIRPYYFINLDGRNRWYILDWKAVPEDLLHKIAPLIKDLPNADNYLYVCDECKATFSSGKVEYNSIPEFSVSAWTTSEKENEKNRSWGPALEDYKPGLSKDDWLEILNNPDIIGPVWGGLLAAFYEMPEGTTCTQIAQKYNMTADSVSGICTQLSKRVYKETNCPLNVGESGKEEYWPILLLRKKLSAKSTGAFEWKLRTELYEALTDFDIMRYQWNPDDNIDDPLGDSGIHTKRYWLYAPGPSAKMWDQCYKDGIMVLGWDELQEYTQYSTKEEIRQKLIELNESTSEQNNAALAVWQFAHEISVGDVIFVKRGRSEVLGMGIVESGYYYDSRISEEYPNARKVKWTHKGNWPYPGQAAMKTLTDITSYTETVDQLMSQFEEVTPEEEIDTINVEYPPYNAEDFLSEVFMTEDEYYSLVGLIRNKKNVILQGAPGVGKTYAARRLAYSMMGKKDKSRVMMVQFHQSYSYEDFIMGFRPNEKGFELKKGAFYNFCKEAENNEDIEYFFIIDEINRGNLSKIFGELFMLIESDKRGVQLQLLYSNEKFSVPKNVYIIGMMNTADRSLAMLDYALRRRFAFYDMTPGYETDGFIAYQENLASPKFNALIDCVKALNDRIANDDSLGEGFCIGHSYFCNLKEASDEALTGIVNYELVPLLKEYWFDEPSKVKEWTDRLKRAIS